MLQGHSNSARKEISQRIFSNPWSIFQSFCFFLFSWANFVTAFKFMGNQSTDLFVTQWITNHDNKKTQKSACSKNSDQFWKGTTTSSPKEEKESLLPAPQTHTHTEEVKSLFQETAKLILELWSGFRTSVHHSQINVCSQVFYAKCYLWKKSKLKKNKSRDSCPLENLLPDANGMASTDPNPREQ